MDVRDILSSLLPPPRDDEPASLRQDILEELGDHLACANNRELLRGADASVARQRVLERFGDPAALARRLWFDAMKGKIMAQRLIVATCLAVMLAIVSLAGSVWIQSSRVAAQSAEANRKLAEALAKAQVTNKDMLNKLSEMSEAIRNPRSPDWNPVRFKLTEDTPDGLPVAGCSVTVTLRGDASKQISRITDASGVADFGLVHPGNYSYQVSMNRDRSTLSGSGYLNVEPGSRVDQRVVCPRKALEPVPLHIRCNWPADLQKAGLIVDAIFHGVPVEKDDISWSSNSAMGSGARSVFLGPGTARKELYDPSYLSVWANPSASTIRADILTSFLREITGASEPLKWPRGTYRLFELIVLRPDDPPAGNAGRQRFELLVRAHPFMSPLTVPLRQEPPTEEELRTPGLVGGFPRQDNQGLTIPEESWSKIPTSFEAGPDHVTEWTITLPEELIKAVREKLKSDGTRKPQSL
jgi:hypothetical protein